MSREASSAAYRSMTPSASRAVRPATKAIGTFKAVMIGDKLRRPEGAIEIICKGVIQK